ncbi:MAG: hypothetical protein LUC23_03285, partial [Prevotellaceae bacterium]|nr:hypothetical protein [Prevotellaceae bacterium]
MNTGNQQFDGNVAVAGNAAVGGNLNVNGRTLFKQDLKVEGYLDAKNVRTPNVGLFLDEETLAANHPRPRNGMYALVGDSLPAKLY